MDRLILFRHGKAEQDSASGDDFDRRLAPRGERESAAMGATLADVGFLPDVAVISPAARTRGTWAAAAGAFPNAELRVDEDLYHADAGAILRAAQRAGAACNTVMIVGHNPGLHELTMRLLVEAGAPSSLMSKASRQFPPAAAAVFLFDNAGRPAFDGLFFPERED